MNMGRARNQIIAIIISLLLSVAFIMMFCICIPDVTPVPEATGEIKHVDYEKDKETGEIKTTEEIFVIGKDITAVRINDLSDLGAITKANYVPDRFVTPNKIPDDVMIVDLTENFEFAEKGTLFFIVMNLDPFAEDFVSQKNNLESHRVGDYWRFTVSLPQIFGASNIYVKSQLIERHGEIENYDFIEFNTSYMKVTDKYLPETDRTQTELDFYTRREVMENLSSSCIITIHYQSDGGIFSGIRDFPLIGTENAIKSCTEKSSSLLLAGFIFSAMAIAVLIVLSLLKQTAKFLPEIIMNIGVLALFVSWYISLSRTSIPMFWKGINTSALFILLCGVILSVGKNFKKFPIKFAMFGISAAGALISFCVPFVPFGTAELMGKILNVLKITDIVFIAVFTVIAAFDDKNMSSVLRPVCAVLIGVATVMSLRFAHVYLVQRNPLFWIYAAVVIADFITIFNVFMNTEKSNAYLTANLNLEVERQVKDIRSVISERDKLLQFVSHDMKKPLASSAILIDNLIERENNGEQIKALNIVKQNTARVLENLSEIASYARYNYIAEPSRALNVKELFASLYKYCSADCEACGIVLKNLVTGDYNVFAKRQGLENAATNIILNAVEHADCTEIELSARTDKNKVVLEISDNGKGMSPDTEVFKPYISEDKPESGGLGLYICKNIIESMNGELSYIRRNGKTVFIIVLLKA